LEPTVMQGESAPPGPGTPVALNYTNTGSGQCCIDGDGLWSGISIGCGGSAADPSRGYLAFDTSAFAVLPYSVQLTIPTWTNSGGSDGCGADMAVQVYVNNWGPTLEAGDWGNLSAPVGSALAGPFADATTYTWTLTPGTITLGGVTYLELASTAESATPTYPEINYVVPFSIAGDYPSVPGAQLIVTPFA
jgi:hypothetical protein